MPCSFIVLIGLEVAKRKYLRSYTEVFTARVLDVGELRTSNAR